MSRYSQELKDQIVKKMMPPNSRSVADISRETGISAPTLYAWKKQYRNRGYVVPAKPDQPDGWGAKTKLAALIKTASMNEAERVAYCRENGLYVEQLEAWKQAFESMPPPAAPISKTDRPPCANRIDSWHASSGAGRGRWQKLPRC